MTEHHGAKVAQALALALASALETEGMSVAALSRLSGVSRLTISNVLEGRVWPDLLTVASLERALDRDLWPGRNV
ncbi:helix-turn-helix domain-containing protein [[Kitasatospora] papulosa]|uniref:helix-turn-helix domain-containing protein n=1 Tax=[Kitasatospora] papulosa TaxID=1464011 RepID=UPI00381B2335